MDGGGGSVQDEWRARRCIGAHLTAHRLEIEQAILSRIARAPDRGDRPEDGACLRGAVSAGVDHGLAGIERGASRAGPIPEPLLAAADRSARNGVGLELVLRGYVAGYAVFCDFVLRAVEDETDLSGTSLRRVLRAEATLFERILVAVAEAYARERRGRPRPRRPVSSNA